MKVGGDGGSKGMFGIKASMAPAFEVCMLTQAVCVFMAFFMASRSQTVSVVLSSVACALVIPIVGIIILSAMDRGDDTERAGFKESVVESIIAIAMACACMLMFFPRTGRFAEKNPYSNNDKLQCIVEFIVGRQFVIPGTMQSDGYIMKVPEGEELIPPKVFPKPGLTFIGWRYSGTGDPDIASGTPIYLDADGTENNAVTLYAEYVDAEGNTYCACGAMGEGEFDGASWQNMNARNFFVAFVPLATASIIGIVVLMRQGHKRGAKKKDPVDDEGMPVDGIDDAVDFSVPDIVDVADADVMDDADIDVAVDAIDANLADVADSTGTDADTDDVADDTNHVAEDKPTDGLADGEHDWNGQDSEVDSTIVSVIGDMMGYVATTEVDDELGQIPDMSGDGFSVDTEEVDAAEESLSVSTDADTLVDIDEVIGGMTDIEASLE